MFYSVDGKIVEVGGAFPERRNNTLSFTVSGEKFPDPTDFRTSSNGFIFVSTIPQFITVNFGDGVVNTYPLTFTSPFNNYGLAWTQDGNPSTFVRAEFLQPSHFYQDSFTGERIVTIEFEDITKITSFESRYFRLRGVFPRNILSVKNLTNLTLTATQFLEGLPDIGVKDNLTNLTVSDISESIINKIPDSFFNSPLRTFIGDNTFDLSDPISSNLFKVNQLTELTNLRLQSCNIKILPENIFVPLTKLSNLRLAGNLIENPEELEKINSPDLSFLYISQNTSITEYLFDTSNMNSLSVLYFTWYSYEMITQIPAKWTGLKSLNRISMFSTTIGSQENWNLFIDKFYELCTSEAYLDPSSAPTEEEYPNKFRDITYGGTYFYYTPNGVIEAPTGFVQGVSNGDLPMTQGEKIYVLKENYGHIITTAQP